MRLLFLFILNLNVFGLLLVSCTTTVLAPDESISESEKNSIYDETGCLFTSYEGLVMAGYQGWFTAEGDGADRGWHHYEKNRTFLPGVSTIDFWPDVSEYKITYGTDFRFKNGQPAHVYSSYDEESVDLHFKWMKEYGIDGVFLQRFISEIKNPKGKNHFNKVLENALKMSIVYEKAICIMYDLSGSKPEDLSLVSDDLKELQQIFDLFNNKKNPTYLRHNKKPLVAIWGAGFNDGRKYSIQDVQALVNKLKQAENPVSVLLGIPYYWRDRIRDAENSNLLHPLIESVDIILPWAVGRYNNQTYEIAKEIIADDIHWCEMNDVDYVPVVFPGFSWGNLKGDHSLYNQIPREKGDFFWNQVATAKLAGSKMLYIAMFDEVDEGTAIFKCLKENEVPLNGSGRFIGIENTIENDYYLWLAGQAANWFHGNENYGINKPAR